MDKFLIIIIGSAIIFISCTPKNTGIVSSQNCYEKNSETWVICDTEKKYTYKYPEWIRGEGQKPSGVKVFTYDETSCPTLGVSNPKKLEDGTWGKADYFDIYYTKDFPNMQEPFCRPHSAPPGINRNYVGCEYSEYESYDCAVQNRQYEIDHGLYSAYAFCAEKDGKAVAICIQQMTDDEALAKQIFESFRWTD